MSCYCYFSFSPTAEPQLLTSGTWRCLPNGPPIWSALGSCLGSGECLGWTPISECLLGCAFWCGTLQGGLAPFSYQVTLQLEGDWRLSWRSEPGRKSYCPTDLLCYHSWDHRDSFLLSMCSWWKDRFVQSWQWHCVRTGKGHCCIGRSTWDAVGCCRAAAQLSLLPLWTPADSCCTGVLHWCRTPGKGCS